MHGIAPSQGIASLINSRKIEDNESKDVRRIKEALCFEQKFKILYPQNLCRDDLKQMAKYVNNTCIHYSGNCALLSACLHYNIHHREDVLSSKNTSSPTVGLESEMVDEVIFGKPLEKSCCLHSISEVKQEILRRYEFNKETSFIISAENYIVPIIGECEHDFNAVVLCKDNMAPYVQFIDAWKTSDILPTHEKLIKHFPSSAHFYIRALHQTF